MTIEFDPIEFDVKPALFILDNWQTHDLLSMHHTNFNPTHFITNGWNVIDRYVPYELPWCQEWSIKAYNFAKVVCSNRNTNLIPNDWSSQLTVTFYNLVLVPDEGLAPLPAISPIPFPLNEPEKIELIIEPNKTLYLTWLVVSKEVSIPADRNSDKLVRNSTTSNYSASIKIFERQRLSIPNGVDEETEFTFKVPPGMANFSLVITNGRLKEENETNDYLYDVMDARLQAWLGALDISYLTIDSLRINLLNPTSQFSANGTLEAIGYGQRSPNLHYAGLLFANNNPWGEVDEVDDLGFSPLFKPSISEPGIEKPMPKVVDVNRNLDIVFADGVMTSIFLYKSGDTFYPPSASVTTEYLDDEQQQPRNDIYQLSFSFINEFNSEQETATFEEIVEFLESQPQYLEELSMVDSPRIKEIHAALEADRYGVHPKDPEKQRLNNLGRYLETLAYAMGIAFNEDGKNIPQPESNWVDADYIQTINANQSLRNGQFAVREVNDAYGQRMVCDALFEVRAKQVNTTTDEDGKLQVASTQPGGAMRVPHIFGILDTIQDDLTKYWGGGDIMVPKVDGTGVVYYDSMGECLADTLYMLGSHSKSINELQNQSIKTVFLLQEILRALGLPCHVATVKGVSPSAPGGEGGVIPCPELDEKSPTLASLMGLILINLSRVVGASIAFREDDSAPPPPPGPDSDPDLGGVSA